MYWANDPRNAPSQPCHDLRAGDINRAVDLTAAGNACWAAWSSRQTKRRKASPGRNVRGEVGSACPAVAVPAIRWGFCSELSYYYAINCCLYILLAARSPPLRA